MSNLLEVNEGMMFQISNQSVKYLFAIGLLCFIASTPKLAASSVSDQSGLTLTPIPVESLPTEFHWSADSSLLTFNSIGGPSGADKMRVVYDVNAQTVTQTLTGESLLSPSGLNINETNQFSPFIDPNTNQPMAFLSPNKRYAVFPSSNGKIQNNTDGSIGTVSFYSVFLADLITNQKVDTTLLVTYPAKSFDVVWNRTSTAFVVMSTVYEIGTRAFVGYVSGFSQQLINIKVTDNIEDNLLIGVQNYVLGGALLAPDTFIPNFSMYGISDQTTPRLILTSFSCGNSVIGSKQPTCNQRISLATYNFDSPTQTHIIGQINGDKMLSASFSAGSESIIWAITDQGLVQINVSSSKLTVIDAKLSIDWAYLASFSPDRKWLAVMNTDSVNRIYVAKLPLAIP